MSLLVSIIKSLDSIKISETSKSFNESGGTIGRGSDNYWVLQDPERYLSGHHCHIGYENGQYMITDLSTNGTFYNDSPNPIGKGAKIPLKDGDTFMIGDYRFSISIKDQDMVNSLPAEFSADPFAAEPASSDFDGNDSFAPASENNPFASAHVDGINSLFSTNPAETDPLAALDKAQGVQPGNTFANDDPDPFISGNMADKMTDPFAEDAAFSDQANPVNQQISWPEAVAEQSESVVIPDDWDDELDSLSVEPSIPLPAKSVPLTSPPKIPQPSISHKQQPVVPLTPLHNGSGENRNAQLISENDELRAEIEMLKEQLNSRPPTGLAETSVVDSSFVNSMGLQKYHLSDSEIVGINQLAGDVIKEMVKGLMQVLSSRGAIKNEFRMHVTTIQPVENNPIKFSANVEDALENMFIKKGQAFKKPVEAVQEGFESVAEHQLAILAGIKSAVKGIIERFDPAQLEERFEKQGKGGFLPGMQKTRNWDSYQQYYAEIAEDTEKSFQYLFGDDFVRAYEEQLQKMSIARKTKKTIQSQ